MLSAVLCILFAVLIGTALGRIANKMDARRKRLDDEHVSADIVAFDRFTQQGKGRK